MQLQDITALINQVEGMFPVHRWTVNGIAVWPFVRTKLAVDLIALANPAQFQPQPGGTLARVKSRVKGMQKYSNARRNDRGMNAKIAQAGVLLMSDGLSFMKTSLGYFDKFCDPMAHFLKNEGFDSIRFDVLHNYFIPRYSPSVFIQPAIDAAIFSSRLFPVRIRESETQGYEAMATHLQSIAGNPVIPPLQSLHLRISKIIRLRKLFEEMLGKAKPNMIFSVNYYSDYGMSLNLAAARLGIPSADIQHGVQGDHHFAYGSWSNVPDAGYDALPSVFWVWSKEEEDAVNRWNQGCKPHHIAIAGGNLLLRMFHETPELFTNRASSEMMERVTNGLPNILLALSWDAYDEQTLSGVLTAMEATQHRWNWWVRLHPVMLAEMESINNMLRTHGITRANTAVATEVPLYSLLSVTQAHVTHTSSTVIEAEEFGVPSVICGNDGMLKYQAQLLRGTAKAACDASSILQCLETFVGRPNITTGAPAAEANKNGFGKLVNMIKNKHT